MNSHWKETLIFICFVIVATALWYGHAMTSVRSEVVPIRVQYTGIDSLVVFEEPLPAQLSIEIRDVGQRIKTYYKDLPTITLNLHSFVMEDVGKIDITEEQLRSSVTSVLQGTSKLLTIYPSTLHNSYYRQASKDVNVVLRTHISPAPEYQFKDLPHTDDRRMAIFGSPDVIENIDTLYTQVYTLENVKDTLSDWVALDLPQGIRAKKEKIRFTSVTERYTEKVFTLPISYTVPDSSLTLRLFPSEVAVTVRCAVHNFNKIDASDIIVSCDFPKEHEERLLLKAQSLDHRITMLRIKPTHVEYLVEQKIDYEKDSNGGPSVPISTPQERY